jgi:GR25 family glycosyltransferase involved in LPS biosynthesis
MNGFYINLKHRADRREHIEKMKDKFEIFKNVERMDAILHERGDIGCALSHINCLNSLLQKNDPYYVIMEDDFLIFNEPNFNRFVEDFDKIKNENWDVITCTPRGNTTTKGCMNGFNRIINNQTATCYIIKHAFIKTLLEIFNNGVAHLQQGHNPNNHALDQCWKPLQLDHIFMYYEKIFGGQLPGYSDIERKNVNYNQRFIQQVEY